MSNHLSFYHHIVNNNQHNLTHYLPWYANGQQVGWLKKSFIEHLKNHTKLFEFEQRRATLNNQNLTQNQLNQALNSLIKKLIADKIIHHYHNEPYPIVVDDRESPIGIIDRSSAAHFGIKAFGQHLNGYVIKNNKMYLWVATRAKDKITFPGKLDHLVAGGLPFGLSLDENLQKECYEEAGIKKDLAQQAISVGTVSYTSENQQGIKPDTLFVYDLLLPESFIPQPVDGEVESFTLLAIEEVMEQVANSDKFKGNCNLVLIDFFIRHGLIKANHPEYLKLVLGLHQ